MDRTKHSAFAYQAVYRYLVELIDAGPPDGERKLPSLRQLAERLGVSVSTTKYAYALLEDQGRIYAKAKFGYFTRSLPAPLWTEGTSSLLDQVFATARQPGMLALSSDAPAMLLSLEHPLLMLERELTRQHPRSLAPLYLPFGEPELRTALAERYTQIHRPLLAGRPCVYRLGLARGVGRSAQRAGPRRHGGVGGVAVFVGDPASAAGSEDPGDRIAPRRARAVRPGRAGRSTEAGADSIGGAVVDGEYPPGWRDARAG